MEFGGIAVFCSNCGSNIPDGSNFCSVCGAKQEHAAPETPIDDYLNEENENVVEKKTQPISFDWSTVKEESHKKVIPEVHSPWGTTDLSSELYESEDFNLEEEKPAEDHSRTMSFIDLLKQERDAKVQAAEEEARQFTEKKEEPFDYSAFDEPKSYYVPPLYKIEEEEPEVELELKEEEPVAEVEEPVVKTEEPTVELKEVPKHVAEEQDFAESRALDDFEFDEPISDFDDATFHGENISFDTVDFDTASLSEEKESNDTEVDLDSELEEILAAGTGKHAAPEDVDLFEKEEPAVEEIKDEEPEVEVPVFEEPKAESPILEEINFDEPVNNEPKLDNKTLEDKTLADLYLNFDADTTIAPEPVPEAKLEFAEDEKEETTLESLFEGEVKEPTLADTMQFSYEEDTKDEDSEIEDLKRRLSNLMGSTPSTSEEESVKEEIPVEEEIPVIEEVPVVEELPVIEIPEVEEEQVEIPVVEIPEEKEEEPLVFEIKDDEEDDEEEETILEIQLGTDDEEKVEPEKVEEKPATDAISVDDLEKDLFGEVTKEDIEAEATKKIDKFYTLYKKNEEFQRLLDEEYNKLKTADAVPHVDDLLNEKTETVEPVVEEETVAFNFDNQEEEKKKANLASNKTEIAEEKAAKKEAKRAAKAESDGSKLTVLAVIIAALLVIVLGIILVLYLAPYSGLAMQIDSFLETITSLFSATDIGTTSLLM